MKKTVTKEEYICDFCGRECTNTHTDIKFVEGKTVYTLYGEHEYISQHKDLCPRCANRLYEIKDIIKDFCKSPLDTKITIGDEELLNLHNNPRTIKCCEVGLRYYK